MEKTDKIKNFKKVIIRFATVFFIVMLVLLFFSRTVETMLLPAVTVYTPQDRSVSDSYSFKASVNYESTKIEYPMFSYFISDILVEAGQAVEAGQPIAKLRKIDIDKAVNQYEQEIFALETNVYLIEKQLERRMSADDRALAEKQLELAKKSLEEKESEKELYFSKIDNDYNLLSDFSGTVIKINISDQCYIDITTPILEYVDETIGAAISWEIPKSKKEIFDDTSRLYIEYTYNEQNEDGKTSKKSNTKKLPIDSIEYNPETEMYTYKVKLDKEEHKNIISAIEMTLRLVTEPVSIKDAIPASAVYNDPDSSNGKVIYVINEDYFTKEITVKQVSVVVMKEYGMYVQVAYEFSHDEEVVLTSTKALRNNMKVKLR